MSLERFVGAREGVYGQALAELRAGTKTGHWMGFVFPQIAGLGRSPMARRYAIRDLAEARAYPTRPIFGPRLVDRADAVLGWAGRRTAEAILGGIDAVKWRSSATLFEAAGEPTICGALLDAFCAGDRDPETLARL